MVTLPNAPWCCMVTLNGTNQGTKWQNKLHFSYPANYAVTASNLLSLMTGVQNAWSADIAPLCSTSVTLTSLQAVDLNARTGPINTLVPATPPVGTRTGTAMPAQTALTASWVVQLRYRGGHCRTYFPGGVLADVTGGNQWVNTFRTLAATNFGNFLTAINAVTVATGAFQFIMLSYYSGSHKVPGQPPPPPVLRPQPQPFNVAGVAVHPRIDTQRKRLGKELP